MADLDLRPLSLGEVLDRTISLTIATAVFYYDLRVRKEAFDPQLMMNVVGGASSGTATASSTPA
ncbi:MAG TPA: hypothetical protein VJO53_08730 [Candidatus Acidoferrales bacterium]|nr:hypothetical protein [Candidatus Acidoferrales bacterium]